MRFKKITALLSVLAFMSFVIAGCGAKPTEKEAAGAKTDKTKFNIGYLPAVGDVLFFVAKEKGFFDGEGLDVSLFQFTNSGEGLNAVKSGKLDAGAFGTSGPQTFIAKGTPFVVIGGMQSEGHAIIAKPENADKFKDVKGFIGSKVATVRLATGDAVWRSALTKEGIDWKSQVNIQELDSPATVLEAVKKGTADAGLVWVPFSEMAEQQGLKIVGWSSEYMKGHTCCRVVAVEDKIKENRENYVKLTRALIRAYDFYTAHQDETVDIISKYVKLDKTLIKKATYSGHIKSIPDPDKKRFTEFWDAMKTAGYIQSDIDISKFVNTDIYKEALSQLRSKEPENTVYIQLEKEYAQNDL